MAQESQSNIFAPGFQFIREIQFTYDTDADVFPEWSPDGNVLAIGSTSGAFGLWHQSIEKMELRTDTGSYVKWASDSQRIAVAYMNEGVIAIQTLAQSLNDWEARRAWRRTNTFRLDGDSPYPLSDIQWLSGDRALVIAYRSKSEIGIYDVEKTRIVRRFQAESGYIDVSPDGKQIITIHNKVLQFRNIENPEKVVKETKEAIGAWDLKHVDWSPNGVIIAVAANPGIHIFDTRSWEWVRILREPKNHIHSLKFSPNGDFLAAICHDNVFRLWNCQNWQQAIQVPDLIDKFTSGISFHPNQPIIATAAKGKVKLWKYQPDLFS